MAWVRALRQYKYPVNLALFRVGHSFSDKWFRANLRHGDWQETVQFEARFREFGPKCLEAWYEVVFWKLFSLPLVRNGHTSRVIERCASKKAEDLWEACDNFLRAESRETLAILQGLFFKTKALPVVATFIAFAEPDRFPMIDVWVVRWVSAYKQAHPTQTRDDTMVPWASRSTAIGLGHWDFYYSWVKWCRSSARSLGESTGLHWRARDVEMAVFQNSRALTVGAPLLPLIN
jgi:hypothetical protein